MKNVLLKMLKDKHMTQIKFAKELGVSQSLISQWNTGKCEPRIEMLPRIAFLLGASLEELVECFKKSAYVACGTETSSKEYTPSGGKSNGQEST